MIELSNIYKDFDVYNALGFRKSSSLSILRNINCKILYKDSVGIIGKNGSGKINIIKVNFWSYLARQRNNYNRGKTHYRKGYNKPFCIF